MDHNTKNVAKLELKYQFSKLHIPWVLGVLLVSGFCFCFDCAGSSFHGRLLSLW